MQASAMRLIRTNSRKDGQPRRVVATPESIKDIEDVLTNMERYPSPLRPAGSASASTRCNHIQQGTLLDMRHMNRLLRMTDGTVTVQAGMRLRDLAQALADEGMELLGGCELPDRTVGGAVSSGALTAGATGEGGTLASSVEHVTLITADGKRMEISPKLPDLMRIARLSYGLLGVIALVTFRIRPIEPYEMRHSKFSMNEFAELVPDLEQINSGVKFYLFPFRDKAYVELRCASTDDRKANALSWKIKDWATNSALPAFVHHVGRIVPIGKIRDPLIDGVGEITQSFLNTSMMSTGSNAAEQSGRFHGVNVDKQNTYSTWVFPASKFVEVLPAYREFCKDHYEEFGFRCDLPASGFRINQDRNALMSPTQNEAGFALTVKATHTAGWENYALEYADFASRFGGVPLFNQSKSFTPEHVKAAFGEALQQFRVMRERMDPDGRFRNQFFLQHVG
ncbi:MAG: FAD-binding protein [Gammaproteobacteria bacterium]